ncbi:hypothetical protein WN51_03539 [Melipona quadrifasciata]|uniref:Uncharacterized protein n=1 Tax=Melipona quadrifasciata TaxID=166423 RepID=A0A0N0BE17_9HYME|nr:hypothetical protein WN51_03539 [Melipona quadrifasciata]
MESIESIDHKGFMHYLMKHLQLKIDQDHIVNKPPIAYNQVLFVKSLKQINPQINHKESIDHKGFMHYLMKHLQLKIDQDHIVNKPPIAYNQVLFVKSLKQINPQINHKGFIYFFMTHLQSTIDQAHCE